jgi:hypothetical protein
MGLQCGQITVAPQQPMMQQQQMMQQGQPMQGQMMQGQPMMQVGNVQSELL